MSRLSHRMYRVVEQGTLMEWINVEALVESAEVLVQARHSIDDLARDQIRSTLADSWDTYRQYPLSAPLRVAWANTGSTVTFLGNAVSIYRDAFDELKVLNQERVSRIALVD